MTSDLDSKILAELSSREVIPFPSREGPQDAAGWNAFFANIEAKLAAVVIDDGPEDFVGWADPPPTRYFEYRGPEMMTRGNYGVGVRGGHSRGIDGCIYAFDPDYGEMAMARIEEALESGDWVEITQEEWARFGED